MPVDRARGSQSASSRCGCTYSRKGGVGGRCNPCLNLLGRKRRLDRARGSTCFCRTEGAHRRLRLSASRYLASSPGLGFGSARSGVRSTVKGLSTSVPPGWSRPDHYYIRRARWRAGLEIVNQLLCNWRIGMIQWRSELLARAEPTCRTFSCLSIDIPGRRQRSDDHEICRARRGSRLEFVTNKFLG